MDYHRIYSEFIADRKVKPKPEGYTERHHIVPRSLGGSDDKANLIDLTAREHYFAHCCLAKMHGGKMWSALFAVAHMAKSDSSWQYFCRRRMVEASREKAAERRSEQMTQLWASGQFKRNRIYLPWSDEQRAKHSAQGMGLAGKGISLENSHGFAIRNIGSNPFVHLVSGRRDSNPHSPGWEFWCTTVVLLPHRFLRWPHVAAWGWMKEGTDRRAAFGRDPTVRQFANKDGDTFVGTVFELRSAYPHLDCGSISKMVNGKLGSVNGWKLKATTEPNE